MLIFFIFIFLKVSKQEECDEYNNNCYWFYNYSVSWISSEKKCKQIGARHLVSYEDQNEINFVISTYVFNEIWIGLNNISKYYGFEYSDGIIYDSGLINVTSSSDEGICVVMKSNGVFEMSDCMEKRRFVCKKSSSNNENVWDNLEYDVITRETYCDLWSHKCPLKYSYCNGLIYTNPNSCSYSKCVNYRTCCNEQTNNCDFFCNKKNQIILDNVCYGSFNRDEQISFYEAENLCRSNEFFKYSHLASIESSIEENTIIDLFQYDVSNRVWIGLYKCIANELNEEVCWIDGNNVNYDDSIEPFAYHVKKCYFFNNGIWKEEFCSETQYLVKEHLCKITFENNLPVLSTWNYVSMNETGFYCEDFKNPCPDEFKNCFDVDKDDLNLVCNGHGTCNGTDRCLCYEGYENNDCSGFKCYGYHPNNVRTCHGNGDCIDQNHCRCFFGYEGDKCEISSEFIDELTEMILLLFFIFLVIAIIIIFTLIVVFYITIFIQRKHKSGFLLADEFEKDGRDLMTLKLMELEEEKSDDLVFNIPKKYLEIEASEMKIFRIIDDGFYSTIYLVKWITEDKLVVLKKFKNDDPASAFSVQDFERELHIATSLTHPNICKTYGCVLKKHLFGFILEYYEYKDLQRYMKLLREENVEMGTLQRINIIQGIAKGMKYLHERRIMHKFLYPKSILLSKKFEPAITDFGLSRVLETQSGHTKVFGNCYYVAPELIIGSSYSFPVDVFSFSMICFEIITSREPFSSNSVQSKIDNDLAIEFQICNDPNLRPVLDLSKEAKEYLWVYAIIRRMWQHKPRDRPDFYEIVHFFKTAIEMFGTNSSPQEINKIVGGNTVEKNHDKSKVEDLSLEEKLAKIEEKMSNLEKEVVNINLYDDDSDSDDEEESDGDDKIDLKPRFRTNDYKIIDDINEINEEEEEEESEEEDNKEGEEGKLTVVYDIDILDHDKRDLKGKYVSVYTVLVIDLRIRKKYFLFKTVKDFLKLYKKMKRRYPLIKSLQFPKKYTKQKFTDKFVGLQKIFLSRFLSQLTSNEELSDDPDVAKFLEIILTTNSDIEELKRSKIFFRRKLILLNKFKKQSNDGMNETKIILKAIIKMINNNGMIDSHDDVVDNIEKETSKKNDGHTRTTSFSFISNENKGTKKDDGENIKKDEHRDYYNRKKIVERKHLSQSYTEKDFMNYVFDHFN